MIRPILTSLLCVAMQFSLFIPGAGAQSAGTSAQTTHAAFDHLVDEFFDFYFRFNPTAATQAGFHQYDSRLEDYSRSAIEAQISGLQGFLTRFGAIQSSDLSE